MSQKKRKLLHLVITLALLALGAAGMGKLAASRVEVKKRKPPVPAPRVRVIEIRTGATPVRVAGEGTVRPLREINLVPQVGGKVVYLSPALVNGGEFREGETLLRIEPIDYQLAVTLAEAKVIDAKSRLKLAEEQTASAREEWYFHLKEQSRGNRKPPPLVAKEPQLAAAKAALDANRAELEKARLNLERTELKAPFDGRVSQENVDMGQFVSPGQVLAALYSIEAAEIVLPMEDKDLLWFHVPGLTPGSGPGSQATVRARIAGRDRIWKGRVVRAQGKLDERTRMVNVVVRVERPYEGRPPLAIGKFVNVEIRGRVLEGGAVIPRAALRRDKVVWVVDRSGHLGFRAVEVARYLGDKIVIRAGLKNGERVVLSPLKAVSDGMVVRPLSNEGENES